MDKQNNENIKRHENFSKKIVNEMKIYESSLKERISLSIKILNEENNENARCIAAKALGEIGDDETINSLIPTLNNESSPIVRSAILQALSSNMDDENVFAAIINARDNDKSPIVIETAKNIISEYNKFLKLFENVENINQEKAITQKNGDLANMKLAASEEQINLLDKSILTEDIYSYFGRFEVDGISYKNFYDEEGKVYLFCSKGMKSTHIRLDGKLFELKAVTEDNTICEILNYTLADMEDFLIDYKENPDAHNICFELN
ncbi:MAG: hypothetical protein SCARUB_04985 [Candidatus Scalindua rubra]|uniref:HEAT repeat protein n=1 Tax=Candidatus Scalindua rubra TaxID=1872076 RepID=A0A1E3X2P4_9BACT|nr:MAG: hypothetical protein SCARUB_04985 [Candidatus Scalindua rubra]